MTVTLDDAIAQLNLEGDAEDLAELEMYVDAANEWVDAKVPDPSVHPSLVKLATLFLIDHLWQSQRGPVTAPIAGDEIVNVSGVGYAIPNRVLELLDLDVAKASPSYSFPDACAWPDPAWS